MSFVPVLSCLFASLCTFASTSQAAPSIIQLENLTRGSNSNWFVGSGRTKFDEIKAKDDLANLNKTGLRHMRLYLSHTGLITPENPSTPIPEALEELSKAVRFANREGLAVIISPFHANGSARYSPPQPNTPAADDMVKLWGGIAAHLSKTDPNQVFFEIASEPTHKVAADWAALQLRCHQAIRAAAPDHVIIATMVTRVDGNRWDTIKPLTSLVPIPDDKTVYNIHYRSPFVFVHQGRDTTSIKYLSKLPRIPYPSDPAKIADLLPAITDPVASERIKAYGNEKWDRSRIRAELSQAAKWAQKYNVRLTCNEFGAFRKGCPSEDRIAYLRDVREVLEEFGIGWTVWSDNAGIFNREKRPYALDEAAAEALGLLVK